mmetsp:Transcript_82/g.109  ORF Transcript_82/g.109 Transcript_82/m.109 type:complete len:125 (+) Transcript_82:298-672(+)
MAEPEHPESSPPVQYPQVPSQQHQNEPPAIVYGHFVPSQQVVGMPPPSVWTKEPQAAYCSRCRNNGVTKVRHKSSWLAWLCCFGLCIGGLDLGCCLIPFCMDSCKDIEHQCSVCGEYLGRQKAC